MDIKDRGTKSKKGLPFGVSARGNGKFKSSVKINKNIITLVILIQ